MSSSGEPAGTNASSKTPAQILAEQHASHHATVEETVDEEDIAHPPPSTTQATTSQPAFNGTTGTNGMMSAKAVGKQKANDKPGVLNTQDEDAFPSLGTTSKPAQAPGWGAKGAFKTPVSQPSSTGASAPASGVATPTSVSGRGANRQPQTPPPGAVNLPGRTRDHFDVDINDIDKTKSIEKVLADAKKKHNVITGVQETNAGKTRRFFAEGTQQARVRQALMDISKAISVEQRLKIPIPASVSSTIIGKQGANIRRLEQEHGVKIHIERDQRGPSTAVDDPRIDVVEVRGDAAATRVVNQKITDMVKQMQPKVDLPLRGIPPEFYPFLAGRHRDEIQRMEDEKDLRIKIPNYHMWQQQPPPRPSRPDAPPQFAPHGDSHIIVSGDQAAAAQARAIIEKLAQQLQQELLLEELTCEQVLHPYIVGDRGMDPLDFLEQTGCAVIIPPNHHETDDIHIIGPSGRLEYGKNLAEKLMSEKYNRPVDLRKQFADAPMGPERHSRALAQYLRQKALEREFMSAHNAEIVFPVHQSAAPSWSVISSDQQKAVSAKNDLMKITQAFPTPRIQLVEVDPFFHEHIHEMHSQRLRDDHGVYMIVPDSSEEPVVLIYEGPASAGPFTIPRSKPTSNEVKEFERALREAQSVLLGSIPHQGISVESMEVPRKFHDRVRRFVKTEQPAPAQSTFPVKLDFGPPRVSRAPRAAQATPDSITLRGPSPAEIAALKQSIEQFLIEAEAEEKERGYVTFADFPEKFVRNLVGKNGANIKALREKHDVEIDTRDAGKVKIQGPQKKAEACKAEIIRLGKQYEDEVNYVLKVDPKFHGELIGRNGETLTKLQDKVNREVRIDFPRVNKVSDTASVNDGASEAGGQQQRQAADEIRIRGPRAKADKIREELLSLYQYLQDNSHAATVSVHRDQVRSLIGRGGAEMEKLRLDTGAQIDIPNRGTEGERVTITIKGTKQAVDKASSEIRKRSKEFDSIVTKTIAVDRKHHRDLIGAKGANIQRIVTSAGGPDRSAEAVQFPKQGEDSNELAVKGDEDVVDKIIAAIQMFVEEKENQVEDIVDVPIDQHRLLIGSNGNIRKSIEQQFNISLDIPRRESGKTGVKVTGRKNHVDQAREHILNLTKQPEGVTILVPRSLHHSISNDGRIFRDLSRQGIKVDHKGNKVPAKSSAGQPTRTPASNGDMPLITDDAGADGRLHTFEIVSLGGDDGETGEIPWVLIGNRDVSQEALAKAQKNIEESIERAKEPRHVGYLRLSDPRLHRHVIGQRGATINRIRQSTGCDIQVPGGNKSSADQGEEITITGPEDGVHSAKDMILEEIEKGT